MNQYSRSMRKSSWALALAAALLSGLTSAAAAPPVQRPANVGPGFPRVEHAEAGIFARVLTRAHSTSAESFHKALRTDLTYAHICNNSDDYRGQVVRIEGVVKRIQRFPPPSEAAARGVNDLFEAWIFSEHLAGHPYCVVFTEWPARLPRSLLGKDRIKGDYQVRLDGYFFKKFRYQARDKNTWRDAPLLIGRSPLVIGHKEKVDPGPDRGLNGLVSGFMGGFSALLLTVFGLTWWTCGGDNRVRRRLLAWSPDFVLPFAATPVSPHAGRPPRRVHRHFWTVLPLRITVTAGSGNRAGKPPSSSEGGKRGSGDKPPEEGAGAQPRP